MGNKTGLCSCTKQKAKQGNSKPPQKVIQVTPMNSEIMSEASPDEIVTVPMAEDVPKKNSQMKLTKSFYEAAKRNSVGSTPGLLIKNISAGSCFTEDSPPQSQYREIT